MSSIVSAFNKHLKDFLNDIMVVLPGNGDLISLKSMCETLIKAKPSIAIKLWKQYVSDKYSKEIENGDITYFLEKDYVNDVKNIENSDKYLEFIDKLRRPVKLLSGDSKIFSIKYIQNLTKMSQMYN
jgi:hypothetical protein